jgi:hypothetical protein
VVTAGGRWVLAATPSPCSVMPGAASRDAACAHAELEGDVAEAGAVDAAVVPADGGAAPC